MSRRDQIKLSVGELLGLLDGRRATTHWAWAREMANRFPAIDVDPAALYVDEGKVMTSAGLSAGIDLSLHVVRKDFGVATGERVVRHMVAAPRREGGQAQFIERPPVGVDGSLEDTRRWATERLDQPLDVATMAANAGVSPRTWRVGFGTAASLREHFRRATATTPTAYRRAFRFALA